MSKLPDRETFVCNCHSMDHQYSFWWDDDIKQLYAEPHLTTYRNFFQRLWYGLKYVFGYKSRYGAFDEMLFKDEDTDALRRFLNQQEWKNTSKEYKNKKK